MKSVWIHALINLDLSGFSVKQNASIQKQELNSVLEEEMVTAQYRASLHLKI